MEGDFGCVGGGYAVEFVSSANNDEHKCAICLLALKKPVQAVPCGHRFCKECIESVRANNRCVALLCPEDRGKIQIFPDAAKEREVLNSDIKCTNDAGCGWNGELRHLEDHLMECRYEKVRCKNAQCQVWMERRAENVHLQTECEYRLVKCPFCSEFYLYANKELHQENCKLFPVECNNKCGEVSIPRNQMEQHTREKCRNSIHQCIYAHIGCNKEGTRASLKEHMKTDTEQHLNYAIKKLNTQERRFSEMERRFLEMETHFNIQRKEPHMPVNDTGSSILEKTTDDISPNRRQTIAKNVEIDSKITIHGTTHGGMSNDVIGRTRTGVVANERYDNLRAILPTCPFTSIIGNVNKEFEMAKRENTKVYSKPFYCLGGYRGQLKIFLDGWGSGRSTHVSVYIKFLIGPFNDILDWPFKGLITITVHGDNDKHEKTMNTDKIMQNDASEVFQKPMARPTQGKGFSKFLSHKQMEKFIVKNRMTFSVNVSPL